MTAAAKVDVPDRLKHSDVWLDWISKLIRKWQKRLAREEAERANIIWLTEYVATLALTMHHAPQEARAAVCEEIHHVMQDHGIWTPPEAQ